MTEKLGAIVETALPDGQVIIALDSVVKAVREARLGRLELQRAGLVRINLKSEDQGGNQSEGLNPLIGRDAVANASLKARSVSRG